MLHLLTYSSIQQVLFKMCIVFEYNVTYCFEWVSGVKFWAVVAILGVEESETFGPSFLDTGVRDYKKTSGSK